MTGSSSLKSKVVKHKSTCSVREIKPSITIHEDYRLGAFNRRTELSFNTASPADLKACLRLISERSNESSPMTIVKGFKIKAQRLLLKAGLPENPFPPIGMDYFWKEKDKWEALPSRTLLEDTDFQSRGAVGTYLTNVKKLGYFDDLVICVRLISHAGQYLQESNSVDSRICSAMKAAQDNLYLVVFHNIGVRNANRNQGRKGCKIADWFIDECIEQNPGITARDCWNAFPHMIDGGDARVVVADGQRWQAYRDGYGQDEQLVFEQPGDEFEDQILLVQSLKFGTWQNKITKAKKGHPDTR